MIKENKERIEENKKLTSRGRILERYQRRKVVAGNSQSELILGKIQEELNKHEIALKEYVEFGKFLDEIAKE